MEAKTQTSTAWLLRCAAGVHAQMTTRVIFLAFSLATKRKREGFRRAKSYKDVNDPLSGTFDFPASSSSSTTTTTTARKMEKRTIVIVASSNKTRWRNGLWISLLFLVWSHSSGLTLASQWMAGSSSSAALYERHNSKKKKHLTCHSSAFQLEENGLTSRKWMRDVTDPPPPLLLYNNSASRPEIVVSKGLVCFRKLISMQMLCWQQHDHDDDDQQMDRGPLFFSLRL